jgi:hypothetical protein
MLCLSLRAVLTNHFEVSLRKVCRPWWGGAGILKIAGPGNDEDGGVESVVIDVFSAVEAVMRTVRGCGW